MMSQRNNEHENGDGDAFFNITKLPDVVQTHLCGFLDLSSLMNLRLTCRDLKNVVDQPAILKLMPIKITTSKQLQRIIQSKVHYNFFILSFLSLNAQSHFKRFVVRFGTCIRKLIVHTLSGSKKVMSLLECCDQLEELELADLDFDLFDEPDNQVLCERIINNLKKLRKLVIHSNQRTTGYARRQIEIFFKILSKCTSLEVIKIPVFHEIPLREKVAYEPEIEEVNNAFEEDWEPRNVRAPPEIEDHGETLVQSVLEYILSRDGSSTSTCLKTLNVATICQFKGNTFLKLASACHKRKIRLADVNSFQFVKLKNEMALLNRDYYKIFVSAKLTHLHEGFPLSKMSNLRTLSVESSYFECTCISNTDDIPLPNLENLGVTFLFHARDSGNQLLIQKLLKTTRPKVYTLKLDYQFKESCSNICALDITNNFRNLTDLNLTEWDGEDDNYISLWTNLSLLEKVTLQGGKMTNRAFVGDFDLRCNENICQRPFNRLTKLHNVNIEDRTGKVTEISMLGSFRWMKLRSFTFRSVSLHELSLNAYQLMANSPFGKSVEYFRAPPPNCRFSNALFREFKNLKKPFG
ncbi:unnamed protein product [Orchesella dallaii]|uniref:F-box domain-containing protein n=1 Tax=Orchesella dallaii TaxID=48710 RepID=A0ABP1R9R7_9HEXA